MGWFSTVEEDHFTAGRFRSESGSVTRGWKLSLYIENDESVSWAARSSNILLAKD
ncbi:MAG: hypothetical protein SFV81_16220 [Pirellulaceae bacterium]|nr:hypothetical protein [Pirellulaceae bacterium]